MTTITRDTPWRTPLDVTYEEWRSTIASARNPNGTGEKADPDLYSEAAYNAARPHTALGLAMLAAESTYGTDFEDNPRSNKNPLNLKSPSYDGTYVKYLTWVGGVKGWHDRITSETYKAGVYAKTDTIAELISTFAPKSENDTAAYIRGVVERMNAYDKADAPVTTPSTDPEPIPGEGDPMATPVSLDYSSLSFPVEVRLIPVSHTHQRTGIAMTPAYSTYHDTGNPNPGTDAESHADWMLDGCRNDKGEVTDTSWHFTVDDGKAIQHIPLNEVAWHAGDGYNGPGNRTSIAIEECVNSDRDAAKTRRNAAELHAFLIKALKLQGGTVNALVQHNRWSGKDCPAEIRRLGLWPSVVSQVSAFLAAGGGTPSQPSYAQAHPISKGSQIINGHQFLAPGGKTFQRDTIPAEWGDGKDNPTGPTIKKGTKITQDQISHLAQGTDGNLYLVLTGVDGVADGSRVPAEAVIAA